MADTDRKIFLDTNILIYAYSETEAEKKARVSRCSKTSRFA